jgi:hypothetical protein
MWAGFGIIVIGALISILEVPALMKKKNYKDSIIYLGLIFIGILSGILISLGITIPTPLSLIAKIYQPAGNLLEKILS